MNLYFRSFDVQYLFLSVSRCAFCMSVYMYASYMYNVYRWAVYNYECMYFTSVCNVYVCLSVCQYVYFLFLSECISPSDLSVCSVWNLSHCRWRYAVGGRFEDYKLMSNVRELYRMEEEEWRYSLDEDTCGQRRFPS